MANGLLIITNLCLDVIASYSQFNVIVKPEWTRSHSHACAIVQPVWMSAYHARKPVANCYGYGDVTVIGSHGSVRT